jgi:hypothetical protein
LCAISEFYVHGGGSYGDGIGKFCREIGIELVTSELS